MSWLYALIDPRDQSVRYVGYSKNPERRLREHIREAQTTKHSHRLNWVRSLLSLELRPKMVLVSYVAEQEAPSQEVRLIALGTLLGWKLTNATKGGEGLVDPSPEVRAKIGLASKERGIRPEVRAKMQATRAGYRHSPETIARISKGLSNPSLETRTKRGIANGKRSPELRHSQALKGWETRRRGER